MLYLWSKHEKQKHGDQGNNTEKQGDGKKGPQGVEEWLTAFVMAQDVKPNSRESYRRTLRQFF